MIPDLTISTNGLERKPRASGDDPALDDLLERIYP